MSWVCNTCGWENEYNDESQPTECLCCGEPASEDQLNLAKRSLEKYHKELEHKRRLEQLRLKAIERQEKFERSIKTFIKSVKNLATACIVFMVLSFAFAGINIYKGSISLDNITDNVKSISITDNIIFPANVISDNLEKNNAEFIDSLSQNVSDLTKGKNLTVAGNLEYLVENDKEKMTVSLSEIKGISTDFQKRYENTKGNIVVSHSNISEGFNNLTVNMDMFWKQANQNINLLIDSISKKVGRSK